MNIYSSKQTQQAVHLKIRHFQNSLSRLILIYLSPSTCNRERIPVIAPSCCCCLIQRVFFKNLLKSVNISLNIEWLHSHDLTQWNRFINFLLLWILLKMLFTFGRLLFAFCLIHVHHRSSAFKAPSVVFISGEFWNFQYQGSILPSSYILHENVFAIFQWPSLRVTPSGTHFDKKYRIKLVTVVEIDWFSSSSVGMAVVVFSYLLQK